MSEPVKYRKKPVVIEAMGPITEANLADVAVWCSGAFSRAMGYVAIETLEGVMRASVGDFVIRGVQGEFYPCKPDIFEATYERLEGRMN